MYFKALFQKHVQSLVGQQVHNTSTKAHLVYYSDVSSISDAKQDAAPMTNEVSELASMQTRWWRALLPTSTYS